MIAFTVPGRPRPKERPRVGRNGAIYTPHATREYEQLVGWHAAAAMPRMQPFGGPVGVRIVFWCKGNAGDLDNLTKAVLDGMVGVAYEDDRQVVHLEASRRRSDNERTEVWVGEIREEAG